MTRPRWRAVWALGCLVLASTLSGCARFPQHLGIRPPEPQILVTAAPCEEYEVYAKYAQELQEAYHSRASQNRGWLYAAGILALGVAAASGGLAAAAAVGAGTLGLLAVSGAFASGSFATLNNEALALSYTVAANSIDQALKETRAQLAFTDANDRKKGYTSSSCAAAFPMLVAGVSDARTHLEVARTDNAAGAMARAKDQLKILKEEIAAVEAADITRVVVTSTIVDIAPLEPAKPAAATSVKITIQHINLSQVGLEEVKVVFGSKRFPVDSIARPDANPTTYALTFTAPAVPPDAGKTEYRPVVLLQGKTRVTGKDDKVFVYP